MENVPRNYRTKWTQVARPNPTSEPTTKINATQPERCSAKNNAADIGIGKICGFLAKKNVKQKDWALLQWWIHSINKQSSIQPWYSQDFPFFDGFPGFPPHHPPFLKTAGGRAPCATWPGSDPSLEATVHWWWFTIYGENDECMMVYVSFMFNLWWICIIYGEYVSFMVNDGCMNMYNLWFKMMVVFCCINNICTYIYIYMYVCVYLYIGWSWLMVKNGWSWSIGW